MAKKPEPFNNPFAKVKLDEPKKGAPPRAPAPPRADPKKASLDDEAALFLESVGEVARVKAKTARVAPKEPPTAAELRLPSEDAESLARLAELVSGETFELSDSTEFIEGSVQGFDERVMKKLRRGEFSHRAELDLHGKTREQARPALEKFIADAKVAGHRCVLVVTGRGLNSPDSIPVIKQSVQAWLTHGRPSRQVLAFCSARPEDGGAGAVYVLLRR
ncbi:MAG: Smr/MutS family protein [Myxococcales bacterium]|nr:Smr/MutS family protein [Myxococcales bacterium]